jgi:hypothetical protein
MPLALKSTEGYIYRAVAVEVPWSEHIQMRARAQYKGGAIEQNLLNNDNCSEHLAVFICILLLQGSVSVYS